MPFRLKFKKSKNYSVVSKSLCVIIVKLLENATVECILSSRTLGQECLENVCQRLQIGQSEYFGLRYSTKDGTLRWVDLDRPLKKQLDKYAQEFSLTLGIMFYVFNVEHLHDELTRYYYFSHLKSDILEGRLRCTREEAIRLASYSLQAEFGDHRPEHHTAEYLKNFVLLPKYHCGIAVNQDQLLEDIIKAHQTLHGMPHSLAEMYYLMAVQRLEGYGEEVFYVKDHLANDVTLGVSALGVRVRYPSRIHEHSAAYQWSEIVDLIHHKKFFKIEGRESNCCAQFQLDDIITAKYIWKQCVQQHKFYMHVKQIEQAKGDQTIITNTHATNESPVRQTVARVNNNSIDSLDDLDGHSSGVYHTDTQSATIVTSSVLQGMPQSTTQRTLIQKEEPDYENVPLLLANSEDARRALLPEYRKAPDYETAMRMKYQMSASLNDLTHANKYNNHIYSNYANSIPSSNIDISPTSRSYNPLSPLNSYSQYGQYTDLHAIGNSSQDLIYNRQMAKTTPNLAYQMHTYSTPELNLQRSQSIVATQPGDVQVNRVPSGAVVTAKVFTSTPDLTHSRVHGAQPDVICKGPTPAPRSRLSSDGSISITPIPRSRLISKEGQVTVNNKTVAYTNYTSAPQEELNITKVQVHSSGPETTYTVTSTIEPQTSSNMIAGPMLLAAMNGLAGPSVKPDILENVNDASAMPRDSRIQELESKLAGGHVFNEFEQIVKKKPMANFATAMLAENMPRNRFKDVLPYEENRVRLGPSKDNRTGYINASHVSVSIGDMHRFYIAAQGPMANTSFHFWQMIWENNSAIIVMLTEVVESGKEKCHPYWPQADDSRVTFKDFVITRKTTCVSSTFTTCALQVQYLPTRVARTIYHLQYTDWPDHGCPMDIHGFLSFMEEIESVRRLILSEQSLALNRAVRNAPVVMHCTAGVGRSGVVILGDLLLFCLDHNHPIDVPQALTYIRYQRMLSVQTLAQYKFVYQVLVQYLKNSRLI